MSGPTNDESQQRSALVVASNRGPISVKAVPDGDDEIVRGGGGLVSGMLAALSDRDDVTWVCAALNESERALARAAARGRIAEQTGAGDLLGGVGVRMLPIDGKTFRQAYNGIANSTMWYLGHMLFETARSPLFDAGWRQQWSAYRRYNQAFAEALDAESSQGASVMIQDYHLNLAPAQLRQRRPDVRIAHFTHTPWAPADYFQIMPDDIGREILEGLLGADLLGFHTPRWADAFLECCEEILHAPIHRDADGGGTVAAPDGRTVDVRVFPLGVDVDAMKDAVAQPEALAQLRVLRRVVGDRAVITRVDRTELSKNIVRGLHAYREFLRRHPEWHNRVVHLAFAYPSRHDLADYRAYTADVKRLADEIDDEFATDEWTPLWLEVADDYHGSLSGLRIADVLLVNPIRDGMNLVVKEGIVLSEKNSVPVLSKQAGAAEELSGDAVMINPFDVTGTAEALAFALGMPADERADRAARLRSVAAGSSPQDWFRDQIKAVSQHG